MPRILVVDDEPSVRDIARRTMAEVGLSCDTAEDGCDAMTRFEVKPYDAVVTDLKMPRRNGHALAVDLLDLADPPSVVVTTALTNPRLARELIRCGVHDILWKPFDYHVLALKMLSLTAWRKDPRPRPKANEEHFSDLMKIERWLVDITSIFSERLASCFDCEVELSDPPLAVTDFVERFAKLDMAEADRYGAGQHEKRRDPRIACQQKVMVVPVNRQLEPECAPFMAAIQDISKNGIRLLHTRAIYSDYMALKWQATTLPYETIELVSNVRRCQPRSPFYSIGGEFLLAD